MSKAPRPQQLNVRAYDVGFGDCFLLTFRYGEGERERHVLIDFGSTEAAVKGVTLDLVIAQDIEARTGGRLDAVIATHRHADHVSGFTTRDDPDDDEKSGDIIRRCARRALILQPWTEHPDLPTDARAPIGRRRGGATSLSAMHAQSLASMHAIAESMVEKADLLKLPDVEAGEAEGEPLATAMRGELHISSELTDQLRFIGQTNIKNESAVRNLMTMSTKQRRRYLAYGDATGLEDVLPGVKVHVLGPPTIEQHAAILKKRSVDRDEYWHLQAAAASMGIAESGRPRLLFPHKKHVGVKRLPSSKRWFARKLRVIYAQQLLGLVRTVDDALNNTSLILLFEIGDKLLLFPGDAQIENWEYALRLAGDGMAAKLRDVFFYKVGHHGSLNATPKSLWEKFRFKRRGLRTVMSTKAGKHGGKRRVGTEVPRKPLVDALRRSSRLFSTQELKGTAKDFARDIPLDL